MKNFLLLIGFLAIGNTLAAQGIDFFQGTWEEAVEAAKKQDKILFVDAYAVWCGPCKRMSNNVFPNDKVGEFYNKHFINVKMDMEHGDMTFRQKYPVSAYPTLFYIDFTGDIVHQVKGATDVDGLIKLGETALSKIDRSGNFEEAYNEGNRDPEFIYNYVKALNKAGKPSLAISNEYLRAQEDLSTPENLRFILEAAVESDSRIFELLIEHRKAIERLEGEAAVRNRIELACGNTLKKAMEFQSDFLLEETKTAMTQNLDAETAGLFCAKADRAFYKSMSDEGNYVKACNQYAKLMGKGKPHEYHTLAREAEEAFPDSPEVLKEAEKWAGMAAKESDDYTVHYTFARLQWRNGDAKGALKTAEKALELTEKAPKGSAEMVQELIRKIRQS